MFNNKYINMEKKYNNFVIKAKNLFGDKYDYSFVEYVSSTKKVKIMCNHHNIEFYQEPSEHLRGKNVCIKCQDRITDTSSLINKLKDVHGDKYDYSLVKYIDSKTKVNILCPMHGIFERIPSGYKQGCPKCYNDKRGDTKRYNTDEFVKKSKEIHGNKYDYSLVKYSSNKDKVKIICPIHGEFEQVAYNHMRGKGCVKCKDEKLHLLNKKSLNDFVLYSNMVHGDKYDYSLCEYVNSKTSVKIICPIHGEFEQKPEYHVNGSGCQKCSNLFDKMQSELKELIQSFNMEVLYNDRKILNGKELDIYIPSKGVAIEFNGLYWHSELYKDPMYHLNKTKLCNKNGVRLIHIFEDEWIFKKDIVVSRIKAILGLTENKIYGRKTVIKEVSANECKTFLEQNHIQGNINSKIRLGLYYNNELVSLMTFGKMRKSLGRVSDENKYELLRFCNKLNTNIIGGASKLLNYLIKKYNPNEIISYADRRWSKGNLYEKLGFTFNHNSNPNYWYIIGKNRKHRFGYRKDVLVKEGYDKNKTEHQIMLNRGIYRIYDCGNISYKITFN